MKYLNLVRIKLIHFLIFNAFKDFHFVIKRNKPIQNRISKIYIIHNIFSLKLLKHKFAQSRWIFKCFFLPSFSLKSLLEMPFLLFASYQWSKFFVLFALLCIHFFTISDREVLLLLLCLHASQEITITIFVSLSIAFYV